MQFNSISYVIPVYKGEKTIVELYERIKQLSEDLSLQYELIFVEDCGGDNSWEIIRNLSETTTRVKGIKLSRNYGQHNALLCGIRAARGDVTITLDDDLQNPPEEIHKLLSKLREGYDVVYGTPRNQTHGFMRNTASVITKMVLSQAMGAKTAGNVSAFRAFKTKIREAFGQYKGPMVSIDVLLTWGTNKFASIEVKQDKREFGESGYTIRKLIRHAFNMITGFSTIPLKIASLLGFFFSFFGLCILAYVIIKYIFLGSSVPGFPFLASVIAIFSGAQLFALGILGEYLARMHLRTMDKPAYIIDEISTTVSKSKI
jgi:glycosyltransferase involved in cell wall biosynthesis